MENANEYGSTEGYGPKCLPVVAPSSTCEESSFLRQSKPRIEKEVKSNPSRMMRSSVDGIQSWEEADCRDDRERHQERDADDFDRR